MTIPYDEFVGAFLSKISELEVMTSYLSGNAVSSTNSSRTR